MIIIQAVNNKILGNSQAPWNPTPGCHANTPRARSSAAPIGDVEERRAPQRHPQGACVHVKPPLGWGWTMNILGLGFDATDIPRVADLFNRFGDRFLQRVFTDGEIAYCTRRRNPVPHLAGRFAAKEATMKALGTGHAHGVIWKDVEVVRSGGPPKLVLHGGAARRAEQMHVTGSLLTITHSDALAMAQVLLLGDNQG
jgi:holo-[acyl-carrier protein] synthase